MPTQTQVDHPSPARSVEADLQAALIELVDLSLLGKQAHWNVAGRNFRSVHLELDQVVGAARLSADRVAERIATIGLSPDGRSATVAAAQPFADFPAGQIRTADVVELIGAAIDSLSGRLRERILRLAEIDPVSQRILVDVDEELEKEAWMLRTQLA